MGQDQVYGGVSILCWLAAPIRLQCSMETSRNLVINPFDLSLFSHILCCFDSKYAAHSSGSFTQRNSTRIENDYKHEGGLFVTRYFHHIPKLYRRQIQIVAMLCICISKLSWGGRYAYQYKPCEHSVNRSIICIASNIYYGWSLWDSDTGL